MMNGANTTSPSAVVCGVNYEGGKIAMDAPFAGEVAAESLRAKGRSETFFSGYDETYTMDKLRVGLSHAVSKCRQEEINFIVIQIARGRSAEAFEQKLAPLLSAAKDIVVKYVHGYRTTSYFTANDHGGARFIFVNIGMFARLSPNVKPGEVFIPSMSIDVAWNDEDVRDHLNVLKTRKHAGSMGSLPFPRMVLIGIEDDMNFVTPEHYSEEDFTRVLRSVNQNELAKRTRM